MPRGRKIVNFTDFEECTLEQASEEFYKHNKIKGLATETQRQYKVVVKTFVEWVGKDKPTSAINAKVLDDYIYYQSLRGLKDVTLASMMKHIRRFIYFAIDRNYMNEVVVTIPKYEEVLKEPYTNEEMKLLLARPQSNRWIEWRCWAMTNYFFSTGQRLSTALNIQLQHIDFNNSKVKLIWNKDKRQKYMPLSSALVKVLQEYIHISGLEQEDYLFPEYEGGQLTRRGAEDAMNDYNLSRGVTKTGIHLFRHTFAKNYIMNGGNPVKLQKLLNHKTIDQTMKYVNLYGTDISDDLDMYNPLDTFKKRNYTPTKRVNVIGA